MITTYQDILNGGNWIPYNAKIAQALGGMEFAVVFSCLLKKQADIKSEWFYLTKEKVYEEFAITERTFEKAVEHLINCKLIRAKFEGMPLRKWYAIGDLERLFNGKNDLRYIRSKSGRNALTREDVSSSLDGTLCTDKAGQNVLPHNKESINKELIINTYTLAPEKNEIKKTISHIDKPLPKTDIDLKNKILIFLNDENDISQEARRAIFEKIQRRQIKIPGGLTLNETLAELVDWWATRRFAKNLDLNINYAAFVAAFKADLDYYNSVQPDEKKYKKDNPIKTTGHIIRTQYDENGVPIPRNKNVTI